MQKLNCSVGDLAIVVNTELPENLGQIVEVLGVQTGHPLALTSSGHVWQVRTVSGRPTLIYRYNDTGRTISEVEGPAPDSRLRPVSGLPDLEHESHPTALKVSKRRRKGGVKRPVVAVEIKSPVLPAEVVDATA